MFEFHNMTITILFSIMSSSDAMFETFFCVFPVCTWASCSCKNRPWFPSVSTWAVVILQFLLLSDGFQLLGFYEWKFKGFGSIRMIFQYFHKIFVPWSEGPPLSTSNEKWIKQLFTKWQIFGKDQFQSICRRQFKFCHNPESSSNCPSDASYMDLHSFKYK